MRTAASGWLIALLWFLLVAPSGALAALAPSEGGDPHHYDEGVAPKGATFSIPEGYESHALPHYEFVFPKGAMAVVRPLIDRAEPLRKELVASIGVDPPQVTTVVLARNHRDFQSMQPGGPLPDWVAGVAYGDLNLVLLRQAGSHGQPINLYKTFEHEMSHIILRQAVPNAELPRWFVEGLAQWQAREFELERPLRLAKAALQGRLIPLDDMIHRFPRGGVNVRLAYDQSFAFVNFLIGEFGQEAFHRLMIRLGEGGTFRDALESTYFLSLDELEEKWLRSLRMTYNWIPLLTSGGAVWTFASILFLMGYVRTRSRKARRMAQWEAEERERDAAIEAQQREALRRRMTIFPGPPTDDDEGKGPTLH